MKRLLIVSPHFPPINAPDMQRVRMCLPHFAEFGWEPSVLAVAPSGAESLEPQLNETLPADVPVERVASIPHSVARLAGVGNIALRALPYLKTAGSRTIRDRQIDLVYFSTTMFASMPLGRVWKQEHGTPYVLDMQDPWVTDYYEAHPAAAPPSKYGLMRHVHGQLEPWTMARVDGLITVADDYVTALRSRYPRLASIPSATIPFPASAGDLKWVEEHPQPNEHFTSNAGMVHGVFTGAAGDFMATAIRVLLSGLRAAAATDPELLIRLRLHFIGTDYATDDRARRKIAPFAEQLGVQAAVHEQTARVPYFQALQLMKDAGFLIVLGSDDPAYSPSKLYPYLLTGRPILAIVHASSAVVPILKASSSNVVITFDPETARAGEEQASATLAAAWTRLLQTSAERVCDVHADGIPTPRETTARQCALFDDVMNRIPAARAAS